MGVGTNADTDYLRRSSIPSGGAGTLSDGAFKNCFVGVWLYRDSAVATYGLTAEGSIIHFQAGAREVHLRVSSPPITHPDFYGIDTPRPSELLAANMSVEQMCAFVGATSLAFLSVDGIYRALGYERRDNRSPQFTDHCFTGDYPTTLRDQNGSAHTGQLSFLSEVR